MFHCFQIAVGKLKIIHFSKHGDPPAIICYVNEAFNSSHMFLITQLICTVTPSSSNSEETHNTLKFAHRAKHIEIQASQNKVIFIEYLDPYDCSGKSPVEGALILVETLG